MASKRMDQLSKVAAELKIERDDLRMQAAIMRGHLASTIGCMRQLPKLAADLDVCGLEDEITALKEFLADGRADQSTDAFKNAMLGESAVLRAVASLPEPQPTADAEPCSPELLEALKRNAELRSERDQLDAANRTAQLALAVRKSERALYAQSPSGFLSSQLMAQAMIFLNENPPPAEPTLREQRRIAAYRNRRWSVGIE